MNLFVFNSEEQLLAVLDERQVVEALHTEQLNNVHSLEFTVLANSDHAFGIMEGNLVAFCDQDDNEFQLFEIAIVEDNHGDVALKTAICEHAVNELLDEYVKSAVFERVSADEVLDYLLSSTRWQKGEVSTLGEASIKIESSNAKSALNELLNTWRGEVRYRVSISGNKIAGRYIDILSRRGNDTGKRFEYDKDVKEIERTVDMTGVKTAIRGYGQPKENEIGDSSEPLTFKDVVWKIENGDPVDKPKGQDWVGDEHARLIWGRTGQNGKRHRYGIYEQSDEKDAEKLLQQTFEYLESTSSPLVNYASKVIDLFRLSLYEHERVHLGDTVAVLDDDVYPKIQERTRIIEIKRDLLDPTNDEIVLGEFLPLFSDPNQELQRVVAKVKENAHVWDKAGRPINPGSFPNIPPETPGNVTATGLFSAVMVEWDFNYLNTFVAGYEVYASEVEGFAGTPETLVYRGRANGYVFQGEAKSNTILESELLITMRSTLLFQMK